MQHAWTTMSSLAMINAKPSPTARAWMPENRTGGYFNARRAAARCPVSCGRCATDRRVATFVAGPKARISFAHTSLDHDPRGSLGSQNPYAPRMTW